MAAKQKRIAQTATEALKLLWERDFFVSWRKWQSIVEGLAKLGNHFSDPELGMALKRARHLTRRGSKGSYEYIQKFQYDPDEPSALAKK